MAVPSTRSSFKAPRGTSQWGIGVSVDIFSTENLINSVMEAVSETGLAPFGEQVADYLEDRAATRFASEGDEASGNWPALTGTTERIRAALGYGPDGPINMRTSEMFSAVVYSADVKPGMGGVVVTKPDPSIIKGTLEQKLITAQQGRSDNMLFPGASTPARPVVALGDRDMVEIMGKLQLYIMAFTATRIALKGAA